MKIRYGLLQSFLVLMLVTLVTSCSSKQPLPTDEQRMEAQKQVSCVVVLPVETKVNSDPSVTYQKASELEKGASFMDSVLTEELLGRSNVRIVSSRQLLALIPRNSNAQLALIRKVGSELKCDAVLTTTLSLYQQRVGGSYGADSPASVLFSMKLFNARDGKVLWSNMFKETQQSLMGNIMSFDKVQNRGLKWITAEELVREGIKEKIAECPYL